MGIITALGALNIGSLSVLSRHLVIAALQVICLLLVVPGLICAMAISNNVHAFQLWVAAVANFLFYPALSWVMSVIVDHSRRRRRIQ